MKYPLPIRLLLIISVSIFIGEGAIMYLFHILPPFSPRIEGLLDALLLTILIFPLLYLFLFRPLLLEISERKKAEIKLQHAKDDLEDRVKQRTGELLESNRAMVAEINERMKVEERLRKLFRAVEQSPVSVVITDTDGAIEYVNPKFTEVTGYTTKELIGQNPRILKSGNQSPEFYKELWDTITSGREWQGEFGNKKKNGKIYWESASIAPIRDNKGTITHFVGVKEDITKQKEADEALKRSEKKYRVLSNQLMITNNMKELLLDIITHDLKNPAGVIRGMSEILVEENPDSEELQLIQSSSKGLLKVIDNATTLSRVAMEEEIEKEELDLAEIIEQALIEFKPILKSIGMKLDYDIKGPLLVKANRIIAEVFKNYFSNAIKYADKGKRIIIETEMDKNTIVVRVKDFGNTIPEKERDRIFERKIQLGEDKRIGSGLGLAIVKRIAAAHGGNVWVEPNKPKGNIFNIKIPRR